MTVIHVHQQKEKACIDAAELKGGKANPVQAK